VKISLFCCSTWILSVELWYLHKIINKPNRPTSISKNQHGIKSYNLVYLLLFDKVFSELSGRLLTQIFLVAEIG